MLHTLVKLFKPIYPYSDFCILLLALPKKTRIKTFITSTFITFQKQDFVFFFKISLVLALFFVKKLLKQFMQICIKKSKTKLYIWD